LINHRPTWHDEPLDLPNGFVIAAVNQGYNADKLVHEILKAHWFEDANHTDPDLLIGIANRLGIDGASLVEISLSDEIQEIHKMNTQEAINRSVFGSPTYFLNRDMFYGQDHLELLEKAIEKPFPGTWPK
jgi:2-hydroxychromene-2-carboxylate isomerase